MDYEEALYHLYINKKLNEEGLRDYISILHRKMLDKNVPIGGLNISWQ